MRRGSVLLLCSHRQEATVNIQCSFLPNSWSKSDHLHTANCFNIIGQRVIMYIQPLTAFYINAGRY